MKESLENFWQGGLARIGSILDNGLNSRTVMDWVLPSLIIILFAILAFSSLSASSHRQNERGINSTDCIPHYYDTSSTSQLPQFKYARTSGKMMIPLYLDSMKFTTAPLGTG